MLTEVALQAFNTLGVPSTAEYFNFAQSVDDVTAALAFAKQRELSIHFIGGGSNLILRRRLQGVVCRLGLVGIAAQPKQRDVLVTAAAGESWHKFVRYCLGQGWAGLETLSLIPGQVGAAPIQNIGAYGTELGQHVHCVQVYDQQTGNIGRLSGAECEFGYRSSLFKQSNRWVVLSVTFRLQPSASVRHRCSEQYPDVAAELERLGKSWASPRELAEAVTRVRRRKLPDVRHLGNVGSVFQNPIVNAQLAGALQQQHSGLSTYPCDQVGHAKMSAAQLIDRRGWKGAKLGDFGVWQRQPLVLVNHSGMGDGRGMLALAHAISADVDAAYGVQLQLEPQVLGTDI